MGQLSQVYVTAHGVSTKTEWVAETAQVGFRIIPHGDGSFTTEPARGEIYTIPTNHGDVAQAVGTTVGTNGTLQNAWTARIGGVGSTVNMDPARQVDLAEDVRAWLLAIAPVIHSEFEWTHIKIAAIEPDGRYGQIENNPIGSAVYTLTSAVAGTVTNTNKLMPPDCALAVSLRAPIAGRRGRGRVYIPGLTEVALESNGTVKSATRTTLAAATKQLVLDLDDDPGIDNAKCQLAVTSAGSTLGVRPSQVRVGNHWDTQRRRENQVPETYTEQVI